MTLRRTTVALTVLAMIFAMFFAVRTAHAGHWVDRGDARVQDATPSGPDLSAPYVRLEVNGPEHEWAVRFTKGGSSNSGTLYYSATTYCSDGETRSKSGSLWMSSPGSSHWVNLPSAWDGAHCAVRVTAHMRNSSVPQGFFVEVFGRS